MTTSQEEISNVKNFLEQQFISISLEWVEACISFINGEHNQTLSLQGLKNLVYQQWLDADLEEIGVSSLPLQMTTTQKMTLNGCFALQEDELESKFPLSTVVRVVYESPNIECDIKDKV
ncbi:UNVERIFIED_CONTAM: hypothetical protein NCL1_61367 [Trichonephila clavipes]